MKLLPILLVAAAGGGALWVAQRSEDPTYAPPTEPRVVHAVIPEVLGSAPADGEVVHTFDVEGMCCNGCPIKLHELLMDVEGVRVAAVSFETKSASVIAGRDVDAEQIAGVLTFDKYHASARESARP